jgi:hypothetical protein
VPATSGTTGQVLKFDSGGAIVAGTSGGSSLPLDAGGEAIINVGDAVWATDGLNLQALMNHAAVAHFDFSNGQTVINNPGSVIGINGGNFSVLQLFNNTAGPLSLTGSPPFQVMNGDNALAVTLINVSTNAITFNGGSGFHVVGGSCTLAQWETVTFFYGGPYIGEWSEVSRSVPQSSPP